MTQGLIIAIVLSFIAGTAEGLGRHAMKGSTRKALFFSGYGFLFATPVYAIWLLIEGIPTVDPKFWSVLILHVPLMVIAFYLMTVAHRSTSMAHTAPYIVLQPAFLLATVWLVPAVLLMTVFAPIGETIVQNRESEPLTFASIIGILVVAISAYWLNTQRGNLRLIDPIKNMWREIGARYMILVSLIFSVTSVYDPLGLQYASAPFYLLVDHGLVGLSCLVLGMIMHRNDGSDTPGLDLRREWHYPVGFGIFFAAAAGLHMLAFEFTKQVPFVIAGKMTGVVVSAIAIGIMLSFTERFRTKYLDERENLGHALPAAALMLVGMGFIVFG